MNRKDVDYIKNILSEIRSNEENKEYYWEYEKLPISEVSADNKEIRIDEGYFLLPKLNAVIGYTLNTNSAGYAIYYDNNKRELIDKYITKLIEAPRPTVVFNSGKINMISNGSNGYVTSKYNAPKIDLDIKLNYNDDFLDIHNKIFNNLTKSTSGLYLLHGNPGTGKTSYLLYLMSIIGNKEIIYMSSDRTSYFGDPNFIDFLSSKAKESIIIIEDAEKILQSRDSNPFNEGVSNILSLTDGIPGKLLNIQIICTFNCKYSDLDQALLRKGRLFQTYEFKPLTKDKAQKLSNHLGYNTTINVDMSLADIYNQKDINGFEIKPRKRAGFM